MVMYVYIIKAVMTGKCNFKRIRMLFKFVSSVTRNVADALPLLLFHSSSISHS
jgi:hypothetical protein